MTERDLDHLKSAIMTAATRYVASSTGQLRYPDSQAEFFIPDAMQFLVRRTNLIDSFIEDHPCQQFVNLGAGMDCRRLRLPSLRNVAYFEIDLPDVQGYKRKVLCERLDLGDEAGIRFIGGDVSQRTSMSALKERGFDGHLKTIWLAEGLLTYLPEDVCVGIFDAISEATSRSGNWFIFDIPIAKPPVPGARVGTTMVLERIEELTQKLGLRVSEVLNASNLQQDAVAVVAMAEHK